VDGKDVRGRRTFQVIRGHHRVRQLAALVRSDVGATDGREGDQGKREEDEATAH